MTELSFTMTELSFSKQWIWHNSPFKNIYDRSVLSPTEVSFTWQKCPFFYLKNRTVLFTLILYQKCPFPIIFNTFYGFLVTKVEILRFCAKPCRLGPKRQGVNFSTFSRFWQKVETPNLLKKLVQEFRNLRTVFSNTVFQKPGRF